jgi:chemotaxis protein methyltransferase CheR
MSGLSATDFAMVSQMLKERSGLILTPDKSYLLESRLTPIARKMGLGSLNDLVTELRTRKSEALMGEITEAMTTNESFFYRDMTPFTVLAQHVLPQLHQSRASKRRLRIWCAAASTGQEPYTLAMILDEQAARWAGWTIEIIGTDLSLAALDRAKTGIYSQFEVQRGLPVQNLVKYFTKVGENWQISEKLRRMVSYRPFNLLDPLTAMGQFDVIFCRNVLIYFDAPTKSKVLERLRQQMPADGNLFLGAAETVLGLSQSFRPIREHRGLYVPAESDVAYAAAS